MHIAKEHRRYRGDTHRPVHPSANTGKRWRTDPDRPATTDGTCFTSCSPPAATDGGHAWEQAGTAVRRRHGANTTTRTRPASTPSAPIPTAWRTSTTCHGNADLPAPRRRGKAQHGKTTDLGRVRSWHGPRHLGSGVWAPREAQGEAGCAQCRRRAETDPV